MEIFLKFFRKFFQTTEIYGNYFQNGELGTQNQTKAMGSVSIKENINCLLFFE